MKTALNIAAGLSLATVLLAASSPAWAQENTSTISYRQNHDINPALISPRGWASITACKAQTEANIAMGGTTEKEVKDGQIALTWLYEVFNKSDLQNSIDGLKKDIADPDATKADIADHEMVLCQLNYLMATLPR